MLNTLKTLPILPQPRMNKPRLVLMDICPLLQPRMTRVLPAGCPRTPVYRAKVAVPSKTELLPSVRLKLALPRTS